MAENNFAVAAFQQLYGSGAAAAVPAHPAAGRYWPYPSAHALPANGLFYQQASAAAAVTLQKPLPYRLYPPTMILAGPSNPLGSLTASSSLSNLSNYYRDSPPELGEGGGREREGRQQQRDRSKSPPPAVLGDRSPMMKEERLYAAATMAVQQAGASGASLGTLTASSSLSNLSNYYRDSPEDGREGMSRGSRQRERSKSPGGLRERSPMCKEDATRLYPPAMLQAGPSNAIASLTTTGSSGIQGGLGGYYRDSPDIMEGREREHLSRGALRQRSASRSPKREDSPQSIRADSDDESIHDI